MLHFRDIIEYLVLFTKAFALRFGLSEPEAFRYLHRYGAIQVAQDYYDVMHTQSFDDMVQSIAVYCRRQGGQL